jgi:hypothetical protein
MDQNSHKNLIVVQLIQDIVPILCKAKIHYGAHKGPPLDSCLEPVESSPHPVH